MDGQPHVYLSLLLKRAVPGAAQVAAFGAAVGMAWGVVGGLLVGGAFALWIQDSWAVVSGAAGGILGAAPVGALTGLVLGWRRGQAAARNEWMRPTVEATLARKGRLEVIWNCRVVGFLDSARLGDGYLVGPWRPAGTAASRHFLAVLLTLPPRESLPVQLGSTEGWTGKVCWPPSESLVVLRVRM
jgi:hypothetical protein